MHWKKWIVALLVALVGACSQQGQCWIDDGQGGEGGSLLPPGQGGQGAFGDQPPGDAAELGGCSKDDEPPAVTCTCWGYVDCHWIGGTVYRPDGTVEPQPARYTCAYSADKTYPSTCRKTRAALKDDCKLQAMLDATSKTDHELYADPDDWACTTATVPSATALQCTERWRER